MSGTAGRGLLDTFSEERQAVGVDVITRAHLGLRDHSEWMETIGMLEPDLQKRRDIIAEFEDEGPRGRERRTRFELAIANTGHEFHGLGTEMNQAYSSSSIYSADETCPLPAIDDPIANIGPRHTPAGASHTRGSTLGCQAKGSPR